MPRLLLAALYTSAVLALASSTQAATISWEPVQNTTAPVVTDVRNNGTAVEAVYYGAGPATRTVNGVAFGLVAGDADTWWSDPVNSAGGSGGDTPGALSGDADYDALFDGAKVLAFGPGVTGTLTLTGLTVGAPYQIQLYNIHDRRNSCCFARAYEVDDESADYVNAPVITRGLGGNVVGNFVADAATQDVHIRSQGGAGNDDPALAAYSLRRAPPITVVSAATDMGEFDGSYLLENTINGSGITGVEHATAASGHWAANIITTGTVTFDLGSEFLLDFVDIWNYAELAYSDWGVDDFDLEVSNDGVSFTTLGAYALAQVTSAPALAERTFFPANSTGRYVRFTITTNHGATGTGLSEVEFYGSPCTDVDGDGVCDAVDNCPPGTNWPTGVANPSQADADGDGQGDECDNCTAIANGPDFYAPGLSAVSQCDKDSDGYGNACDGDFDSNGFVTPLDNDSYLWGLMVFFPPAPGQHDMDCNGFMTPLDSAYYLPQLMAFFPGPSGWSCAGSVTGACPPLP
jgi:hypothetical protein